MNLEILNYNEYFEVIFVFKKNKKIKPSLIKSLIQTA